MDIWMVVIIGPVVIIAALILASGLESFGDSIDRAADIVSNRIVGACEPRCPHRNCELLEELVDKSEYLDARYDRYWCSDCHEVFLRMHKPPSKIEKSQT